MIYFAQAPNVDGKPIKIGTTKRIGQRIRSLYSQIKSPLNLLGVMEGGHREEKSLHRRFSHLRAYGVEWFSPATELLEFISANTTEWDGKDSHKTLSLSIRKDYLCDLRVIANAKGIKVTDYVHIILVQAIERDLPEAGEAIDRLLKQLSSR